MFKRCFVVMCTEYEAGYGQRPLSVFIAFSNEKALEYMNEINSDDYDPDWYLVADRPRAMILELSDDFTEGAVSEKTFYKFV